MIRKGQLDGHDGKVLSAAEQFLLSGFLTACIITFSLALDPSLRQNRCLPLSMR